MPGEKDLHVDQKTIGGFVEGYDASDCYGAGQNSEVPEPMFLNFKRSLDIGDFEFRDMISRAVPVMERLLGDAVLVCARCNRDVEPVIPEREPVNASKFIFLREALPDDDVVFARCDRCDIMFFISELIERRSFRIAFPGEDISRYMCYLQVEKHLGRLACFHGSTIENVL